MDGHPKSLLSSSVMYRYFTINRGYIVGSLYFPIFTVGAAGDLAKYPIVGAISDAVGGMDEGELLIGGGNYGMSTKGGGGGGGGEGVGVIGGTGDVDTGGAGTKNRKKSVKGTGKPKEPNTSELSSTSDWRFPCVNFTAS